MKRLLIFSILSTGLLTGCMSPEQADRVSQALLSGSAHLRQERLGTSNQPPSYNNQAQPIYGGNSSSSSNSNEKTLFDLESGEAIAYIVFDDDFNIYLWNGEPVAYLKKESSDIHIYDFNGKHLGWLEKGVLWNHNGYPVGFVEGTANLSTQIEPIKSIRQIAPIKSIAEISPLKPIFNAQSSGGSLKGFFKKGANDF